VARFVGNLRVVGPRVLTPASGAATTTRRTASWARWSWGYWLIVPLLVVAAWDMVFKPGL
jgi:hypothetical protein